MLKILITLYFFALLHLLDIKVYSDSSDIDLFISYNLDNKTEVQKLSFVNSVSIGTLPKSLASMDTTNKIISCMILVCKPNAVLNSSNLSTSRDILHKVRFIYEQGIEIKIINKQLVLQKFGVNNLVQKTQNEINAESAEQQLQAKKEYEEKIKQAKNIDLQQKAKLQFEERRSKISLNVYNAMLDLIERHPEVKLSHFMFAALISSKQYFDENRVKTIYSKLTNLNKDPVLQNRIAATIEKQIELKRITSKDTGNKLLFPEFDISANKSKQIKLKSVYGSKLTIIDIWASWCAPCRIKHPYYLDFYNKFKDKGLEIISLSIDKDINQWKKAVQNDGMIWKSYLIPKGTENSFVSELKIVAVPASFLINHNNEIIGKNLSVDELKVLIEKSLL